MPISFLYVQLSFANSAQKEGPMDLNAKYKRMHAISICAMLFLLPLSATHARQLEVTSKSASGTGSLGTVVASALAGDTVVFNIAGNDTALVQNSVTRASDLVLLGPNRATGNRPIICFASTTGSSEIMRINKGKTVIRNVILCGGNNVRKGGCLSVYDSLSRLEIDSSEIKNGLSYFRGGAIYLYKATVVISHSTIASNTVKATAYSATATPPHSYCYGGGICNDSGHLIITSSTLNGNHSKAQSTTANTFDDGSYPGCTAYAFGGAIYNIDGTVSLVNCTFYQNEADAYCWSPISKYMWVESGGGAIYSEGKFGSLNQINCTLSENWTSSSWDNYHYSSGWAYGSALMSLCRKCFIIGTIIVAYHTDFNQGVPTADDFYASTDSGTIKLVNSTVSLLKGATIVQRNVKTGVKPEDLFPSSTPVLAFNGGTTQTLALGQFSLAIDGGVRTGFFAPDSLLVGTAYSELKLAWFNGTNWISLETDSWVPAAYIVVPVLDDQRGYTRKDPPCIGAYEMDPMSATKNGYAHSVDGKRAELRGVIARKELLVFSPISGKVKVLLFSLIGRKIAEQTFVCNKGLQHITFAHALEPGTYIFSIEFIKTKSSGIMVVK